MLAGPDRLVSHLILKSANKYKLKKLDDLERTSRLGLTWANGVRRECRPQVKRAQPTFSGPWVSGSGFCCGWRLSVPTISRVRSWSSVSRARSFFALSNRGWYSASSAGGEPPGDGGAADLAGPFGVGSVQPGRVGVAAAVRLAAGVGADGEGAGQGWAGRGGDLGGDLGERRALGCGLGPCDTPSQIRGPDRCPQYIPVDRCSWEVSCGRRNPG